MASKITIFMKVYWPANGKILEGKVKKILSDHAIVHAEGSDYLVQKAALSTKPIVLKASSVGIVKTASRRLEIKKYASGLYNSPLLPGQMFKSEDDLLKAITIDKAIQLIDKVEKQLG